MSYNCVKSFIASGAITEYAVVSMDGDGKVQVTTAATDVAVVGVAQRAASAGDAVDVVVYGETRVIAGESITFNSTPLLAATTAGKVQSVDPAADATFFQIARAIPNINQTSAADGVQFLAFFTGPHGLNT